MTSRASRYTVPADFTPVETLLEIKRSEFMAFALRVESEDEARTFIDSLKKEHHTANHVCSAFVIGPDRDIQRSSDDGEPAGTAGIPMLQAILSHRTGEDDDAERMDVSDICLAVVRYFGGIKLGAGGLVRAYTDAVVQALDETTLITRQRLLLAEFAASHADAGRWENEIRAAGTHVIGVDYNGPQAVIRVGLADDGEGQVLADFNEMLAAITAGEAEAVQIATEWTDLPG